MTLHPDEQARELARYIWKNVIALPSEPPKHVIVEIGHALARAMQEGRQSAYHDWRKAMSSLAERVEGLRPLIVKATTTHVMHLNDPDHPNYQKADYCRLCWELSKAKDELLAALAAALAAEGPSPAPYIEPSGTMQPTPADSTVAPSWTEPQSLGIPLQHEPSAASSLHKEGLSKHHHADLLEAMRCPDCHEFTPEQVPGPELVSAQSLGHSKEGSFNLSQDAELAPSSKRAALHKEGAGGEPPVVCNVCHAFLEIADGEHVCGLTATEAYSLGWQRGHNAASPPLPLQRTLPDEQFKGAVVERSALSEREWKLKEVLSNHWLAGIHCHHAVSPDDSTYDWVTCACSKVNLPHRATVGEAVGTWIEHVLDELAASPAGRAEQP